MDISKLTKGVNTVKNALITADDSDQILAKKPVMICIPTKYTTAGLATIGEEVRIIGIFAYIVDGKYAVSKATSMMKITPDATSSVNYMGADYTIFHFPAGSTIIDNINLVKNKKLVDTVMTYFHDRGYIPWFMDELLHSELYADVKDFNNLNTGAGQSNFDILTALVSRDPKNFDVKFRHSITDENQIYDQPVILPIRDIAENTTSALSKLNGSELQRSLESALADSPSTDISSDLEELYKK